MLAALGWRPDSFPAGFESHCGSFALGIGNSVYPTLPLPFGGDTNSCRSLLSGVYARGSKRSHQFALECVTVVDSTTHSKLPDLQSVILPRKTLSCTCIGRRKIYVAHRFILDGFGCELFEYYLSVSTNH